MKYTKALIFLFLVYIQIGCEPDNSKKDLFGIWESFETHHTKNVLTFYKDSLILDGFNGGFHTNSSWTVDDSKIYLKNIRLFDTIIKKEMTYSYEFNKTKDTLLIRIENGDEDDYSTMKKVEINPFINE